MFISIVRAFCLYHGHCQGPEYSRSICNMWVFQNSTQKLFEYVHSHVHILYLWRMHEVPMTWSGATGCTPQHPQWGRLNPDYPLTWETIFTTCSMYMPSAPVALTDDFSSIPYTTRPCSSVWSTKQRNLVRLFLGWADIMLQKGRKGLFYISKTPLDNVIFGHFCLLKNQGHSALFLCFPAPL